MVDRPLTVVLLTVIGMCAPWIIGLTAGETVCMQAKDCSACLQANDECTWCGSLNACALVEDSLNNFQGWDEHNCSMTAVNSTTGCPLILTSTTPITTVKKLKCSAARSMLPEEECDESVLDEKTDRRGSIMVILPLIAAFLGVASFFVMVIVWIRCCYNRAKDRERDSSDGMATEMSDLAKDEESRHHRAHNGH